MRYYVLEPHGNVLLPTVRKGENAEIVKMSALKHFSKIDYDARSELISDKLKSLMELYIPKYDFTPIVFFDAEKDGQVVYWRFSPPIYTNYQAIFRNDGIVSHISFPDGCAPLVFTVRSPKGIRSIIVRMAVAESTLRRSILGLKFTKLME